MQGVRSAIKKNMIAGLLVTIPAAFTYIILEFVITRVDRMMAPIMPKIIGAQGLVLEKVGEASVNVFVPTSPNPTTGFLVVVPINEVDFLEMTVEEGLKMIISFGLVAPE